MATTTHLEDLHGLLNTFLAICRHGIQEWPIAPKIDMDIILARTTYETAPRFDSPANTNSRSTQSDRLENIRRTSHTTIDHDLKVGHGPHFTLFQLGDDFDQDFNTGSSEFLQASMAVSRRNMVQIGRNEQPTSCRPPWLLSTTPCIPALMASNTS
jgi:hypothetical protein